MPVIIPSIKSNPNVGSMVGVDVTMAGIGLLSIKVGLPLGSEVKTACSLPNAQALNRHSATKPLKSIFKSPRASSRRDTKLLGRWHGQFFAWTRGHRHSELFGGWHCE